MGHLRQDRSYCFLTPRNPRVCRCPISREAGNALPVHRQRGRSSIPTSEPLAVLEPSPPWSPGTTGATDPWDAQSPRVAADRFPTSGLQEASRQGAETAGSTGHGIRGGTGWLLPPLPHTTSLHCQHTKPATVSLLNHLTKNRSHPSPNLEIRRL